MSDNVATYFMNFTQTRDNLIAIGEKVDNSELVSLVLNGLPTSQECTTITRLVMD